jgi:hypothetical protein
MHMVVDLSWTTVVILVGKLATHGEQRLEHCLQL